MYDYFWLNRWALPIILSGILFYFVYYKKTWIGWANKIKDEKWRDYLLFILNGLEIKLGDLKITVLFSAVIVIVLEIILAIIFQTKAGGSGETLWFATITSGFLNPISEEFIMRGILLGAFAYVAYKTPKIEQKYLVYGLGLLITSVAFVFGHDNQTLYQIVARFSISILLGLLYLANDRNLLPPIIAHATSNIFLIFLDMSRGIY